jgi:hypothetical protein
VESEIVAHDVDPRLAALVDRYSRRVYPAALAQHRDASVCSPLGIWLLLAACVSSALGAERAALEEALGCAADEAGELLARFVAVPPPALKAAIAVWVRAADATEQIAAWVRGLPAGIESGFMPTMAEADAWAERHTLGLIKSFPVEIDEYTRIVLASALATKVSWRVPFEVVPASGHLGDASPWSGAVQRLLWDPHQGPAMIIRTDTAGPVAVHQAFAKEELTVISVSADPEVPRDAVLEAAHEVAALASGDEPASACSLFELPLGSGHSWEITEREAATYHAGQRLERVVGASLPAWRAEGELDLLASPRFAAVPALDTMRRLIGPEPEDEFRAIQVALASFTRYGFEAAAITAFAIRTASAHAIPRATGVERTAVLRFDHPYAALAIAGPPVTPRLAGQNRSGFSRLPLFAAWVHEPQEPEADAALEAGVHEPNT